MKSELYVEYGITVSQKFLDDGERDTVTEEMLQEMINDKIEDIPPEDYLVANQQTLLYNEDIILHMACGENNVPISCNVGFYFVLPLASISLHWSPRAVGRQLIFNKTAELANHET